MAGSSDKAPSIRLRFQRQNPKQRGTAAFHRYEKYKRAQTVKKALELGASRRDLNYDRAKGFLQTATGDCPVPPGPRRLGVEALRKPVASPPPGGASSAAEAAACPSQSSSAPRKRPAGCVAEEAALVLEASSEDAAEAVACPSQSSSAPRKRPSGCAAEEEDAAPRLEVSSEDAAEAAACPSQSSSAPRKRPSGCAVEEAAPKLEASSEDAGVDHSQSSVPPRKRPAGCDAEGVAAREAGPGEVECPSQSSAPRTRPASAVAEEIAARRPPSKEAKTLAAECGCDAELARAALGITGSVEAAKSLLTEGPAAAYSQERRAGERPGDEVFRHPYVQCLAEVARQRVLQVLAAQEEPKEQRWLLCVRSYGRAGNPPGFKKKCSASKWKGLVEMTLTVLQRALGPKAQTHCLILVSHEDEDVVSGRYAVALKGTPWEGQMVLGVKGADRQVRFIDSVVPKGTHVIVADDNIVKLSVEFRPNRPKDLEYCESPLQEPLADLIQLAAREMAATGATLWGVNPTQNHFWLHKYEQECRRRAEKTGVYCEYTKRLGLVYGAFFGFLATHDARRYTRYGQVKDDVERTLRYWHCDGVTLRFMRYGVLKSRKPGTFHTKKGGISAASSADIHGAEGRKALVSMLTEFAWRYARFPEKDGMGKERVSDVGLVWSPKPAVQRRLLLEKREKLKLERAEARRLKRQAAKEAAKVAKSAGPEPGGVQPQSIPREQKREEPSGGDEEPARERADAKRMRSQPTEGAGDAPKTSKGRKKLERKIVKQKPSGKADPEQLVAQRRLQIAKARAKLAEKLSLKQVEQAALSDHELIQAQQRLQLAKAREKRAEKLAVQRVLGVEA